MTKTHLGPYPLDTIITGDAVTFLREIPDGTIDFMFVDPPWNVGRHYGNGYNDRLAPDIYRAWLTQLMQQVLRVSRTVIVTPGTANVGLYHTWQPKWILCWHKGVTLTHCPVGFSNWEPMPFWGHWPRRHHSDYVYAPIVPDPTLEFHDCPKPIKLLTQLVDRYSQPGAIVCDPCIGSGTTAVAAYGLGRHYLGCEVNPDVASRARARVARAQPPLPGLEEPQQLGLLKASPG